MGLEKKLYAHMLIVVAFLVVKIFGFWVITRHHGSLARTHLVEILPTDLPELSKPSRDLLNLSNTKIYRNHNLRKTPKI